MCSPNSSLSRAKTGTWPKGRIWAIAKPCRTDANRRLPSTKVEFNGRPHRGPSRQSIGSGIQLCGKWRPKENS